jgi:hypothetical protein
MRKEVVVDYVGVQNNIKLSQSPGQGPWWIMIQHSFSQLHALVEFKVIRLWKVEFVSVIRKKNHTQLSPRYMSPKHDARGQQNTYVPQNFISQWWKLPLVSPPQTWWWKQIHFPKRRVISNSTKAKDNTTQHYVIINKTAVTNLRGPIRWRTAVNTDGEERKTHAAVATWGNGQSLSGVITRADHMVPLVFNKQRPQLSFHLISLMVRSLWRGSLYSGTGFTASIGRPCMEKRQRAYLGWIFDFRLQHTRHFRPSTPSSCCNAPSKQIRFPFLEIYRAYFRNFIYTMTLFRFPCFLLSGAVARRPQLVLQCRSDL